MWVFFPLSMLSKFTLISSVQDIKSPQRRQAGQSLQAFSSNLSSLFIYTIILFYYYFFFTDDSGESPTIKLDILTIRQSFVISWDG